MPLNPEFALKICPPSGLAIELSSSCNLKCVCCPVGQRKIPSGNMSFADFKTIVALLPKSVMRINFSHRGDPTMNPDFPEMVHYAHRRGFFTDIYTNGLLLDRYTDRLLESGLTTLRVDLDGAIQESYENYRIGSDFYRVKDNLKRLVQRRALDKSRYPQKIYIICVVSSLNEHEITAMQNMARELGVDGILFKTAITNYGTKYYNDEILQNGLLPKNKELRRPKRSKDFICPFLWRGSILYNGDVIMCTADFEGSYLIGNLLRENSFAKIFHGTIAQKIRIKILESRELCETCAVVDENHYLKKISVEFT